MQSIAKILVATAATLSLSACGGSSNPVQLTPEPASPNSVLGLSVTRVAAISEAAEDALTGLNETPDVMGAAPGSASYSGSISLIVSDTSAEDDILLGALSLAVQFDDQTVTGDAGSFFDTATQESVGGTLSLENGEVLSAPIQIMTGELSGTLTLDRADTLFDLDTSGVFQGTAAEGNAGLVAGDASTTDSTRDVSGSWSVFTQ